MPLAVRSFAHATPDHDAAVALRRRILRTPLGLDFTAGQLAAEAGDLHLAAFADGKMVATVVLTPYDATTFKLRQMAVDEDQRGTGVGSRLLAAAEDLARREGGSRIVLAARVSAEDFYRRNGYASEGDVYTEVTIPHIRMSKSL